MTTLYGIKNCDSVKKARQWLEQKGINYHFHDFREHGIERQQVEAWIERLGWETVVNKRSTSWKQLDQESRNSMDQKSAVTAILANPTLVKRPLLETGQECLVGFKEEQYRDIFKKHTL